MKKIISQKEHHDTMAPHQINTDIMKLIGQTVPDTVALNRK
ncbi:hypothetical protein [Streptococcus sp. LQJ-218]|nr:hypothetical protein [Streptococcus sp. LQJ-218]